MPADPGARRPGSRLRIYVRDQLLELVDEVVRFARDTTALAARHVDTLMPDQTYLQQAQPSTFGHYVLSFAYPAMRDAHRLLDEFDDINRSPAGAGCVNGTRLLDDRTFVAAALGFDEVIEHTRDAMWQIDGLIHVLASASSLLSTQSKLAEDLEIWSSSEFDFVDLADAYTRSSILMPQKRNPYSLSIVRGASGVLIGRADRLPRRRQEPVRAQRQPDLRLRRGAAGAGPRDPGHPADDRRRAHPGGQRRADGPAGSTTATPRRPTSASSSSRQCGVDYRSAYDVVGRTVREASRQGIPGRHITGAMLDEAAIAETGRALGTGRHGPDVDARSSLDHRESEGHRRGCPDGGRVDDRASVSRRPTISLSACAAAAAGARRGRAPVARPGQAHRPRSGGLLMTELNPRHRAAGRGIGGEHGPFAVRRRRPGSGDLGATRGLAYPGRRTARPRRRPGTAIRAAGRRHRQGQRRSGASPRPERPTLGGHRLRRDPSSRRCPDGRCCTADQRSNGHRSAIRCVAR